MKRQSIQVQGMVCGKCEQRISKAMSAIEGVKFMCADSEKGIVEVEYEPERCSLETIKTSIRNIGYTIDETVINRIKSKINNLFEKK